MLTDRVIQRLKPGMHADEGGLYMRVSPKGKRSWVVRSQKAGKDSWKTIGAYPLLGLADARKKLIGALIEVTMPQAIAEFIEAHQVKHLDMVKAMLRPLEAKPLSIGRVECVAMLKAQAKTGPVRANRMLTKWKQFFSYCIQMGWIDRSPLEGVERRYIGGKETPKERNLSWEEITALLRDPLIPNPLPLLFILVTGLRPTEALWVLRTKQTTKIPTKTTLHELPKSHLIRWFLRQPIQVPKRQVVMSGALVRKKATFTPHDLRRTFVTRLSDLGVLPHVVEKLVNHKMVGMMAVYNRAEFWPERHAAQRLWDKKLLSLRRKP